MGANAAYMVYWMEWMLNIYSRLQMGVAFLYSGKGSEHRINYFRLLKWHYAGSPTVKLLPNQWAKEPGEATFPALHRSLGIYLGASVGDLG